MKFWDCETCGLHGPIVLIQYADGVDGEIKLHSVWKEPIGATLDVFDSLIYDSEGIIGFNVAFDWFHLCQMYTTLILIPRDKWDDPPDVTEYALLEPKGRFGSCIKPYKVLDLMLHARKGPYQSLMDRNDIKIKRVPTQLAWQLSDELEKRIPLKDIYFARAKEKIEKKWKVKDIERGGKVDPDFKDLVLGFRASSALKALAIDALDLDENEVLRFKDIELPKSLQPIEYGYAPWALAVGNPKNWNGAWPEKISHHISHWSYHRTAREYAALDVKYLQLLWDKFGRPELSDDDSELTCMVAACRWRGYAINIEGLKKLRTKTKQKSRKIIKSDSMLLDPVPNKPGYRYLLIPTAPEVARRYIVETMTEMEQTVEGIKESTKKTVLEDIAKWKLDDGKEHPSAIRAKEVLEARQSNYEADFFGKLILAGRFHASSAVTGSLSGRMSGGGSAKGIELSGRARGDQLNPLGVKRTKEVRGQFTLADGGLTLCGGDFSGFEVVLAEAVYNDLKLREDLQSRRPCVKCKNVNPSQCSQCNGKGTEATKIHGLFGQCLFPHLTYEQIIASAGAIEDFYEKSKRSFFATIYGAEAYTLKERINIPIEIAVEALIRFSKRYPGVGQHRQKIQNMFCSMRQPGGIGSIVEWHEPADFIESMFGFRRYFTLENRICKALYDLASDPPEDWLSIKLKVVRRDRLQTASGAVRSALFAAAFAIQASNMRAAANHEIQSAGAILTKMVQRKIWDLQPAGVQEWLVQPLNIHDEIQCPTHSTLIEKIAEVVHNAVESVRNKVPLIKMDWQSNLNSWADK